MNERDEILAKVKAATAVTKSNSKVFDFDINMNGYEGHFQVKHPSLVEQMDIGVRRARLINGVDPKSLDLITDNITFISATLAVVLKEAPEWFNLTELDDYELLVAVYKEYKTWNDTFRRGNESSSNVGNSEDAKNEGSLEHHEDVSSSNK